MSQTETNPPTAQEYIYRIQLDRPELLRTGPTPEEAAIREEHFAYLKEQTQKGVVVFVGRTLNTDDSAFGIAVFRANSEAAAREIMNNDPGVKRGLFHATLFPFRVVLQEGKPAS